MQSRSCPSSGLPAPHHSRGSLPTPHPRGDPGLPREPGIRNRSVWCYPAPAQAPAPDPTAPATARRSRGVPLLRLFPREPPPGAAAQLFRAAMLLVRLLPQPQPPRRKTTPEVARWAAAYGALSFAFTPLTWSYSTHAEVRWLEAATRAHPQFGPCVDTCQAWAGLRLEQLAYGLAPFPHSALLDCPPRQRCHFSRTCNRSVPLRITAPRCQIWQLQPPPRALCCTAACSAVLPAPERRGAAPPRPRSRESAHLHLLRRSGRLLGARVDGLLQDPALTGHSSSAQRVGPCRDAAVPVLVLGRREGPARFAFQHPHGISALQELLRPEELSAARSQHFASRLSQVASQSRAFVRLWSVNAPVSCRLVGRHRDAERIPGALLPH
jgi:hypothetical protein